MTVRDKKPVSKQHRVQPSNDAKMLANTDITSLALATFAAFGEVAKLLRLNETDTETRSFYAKLGVYCCILCDHLNRIGQALERLHLKFLYQILEEFQHKAILKNKFELTCTDSLHQFIRLWTRLQKERDLHHKLRALAECLDFGKRPEERNAFIQKIEAWEEELLVLCPEDSSQWTEDDFAPLQSKTGEPPYAVRGAIQSIFKAFISCKNCPCSPAHQFDARLSLGTYRSLGASGNDLSFDVLLSMEKMWHEARVQYAQETVVQWALDGASAKPSTTKETYASKRKPKPMKVKRLCEPMSKIMSMESFRLMLKVKGGHLFKLQSEKSILAIDKSKDPVTLDYFLRNKTRSFTEKTRRILALFLSYAMLYLHETPWIPPSWGSSDILFLPTPSSAIPLRPFIQARFADLENMQGATSHSEDSPESDEVDPDDVDPDDLIQHHCPSLIALAVLLMEVYFDTPFDLLARRYGVTLETNSFQQTKYIDAELVFRACRGEMPDNSQFHRAVGNCLDPSLWEDENGDELDPSSIKTSMYENVVRPLETELAQAYSSINIDELDGLAQQIDFSSWDQAIQQDYEDRPSPNLPLHDSRLSGTMSPAYRPRSPYSDTASPSSHPPVLNFLDPLCDKVAPQYLHLSTRKLPYVSAPSHIYYQTPKFFDDEATPESHTPEALSSYSRWKTRYQDVYDKFIPGPPDARQASNVKIAILDTGIDLTHPDIEARDDSIKEVYDWFKRTAKGAGHDRNGHGTFTASLVLDYAPDAELYVSKIADNRPPNPRVVAEAIHHAIDVWKVDIINMSFGFPTRSLPGFEELESALLKAYTHGVLPFAAASNCGGQQGRAYPARMPNVICIHSADANGNPSRFSPTPMADDINLSTVGESVESSWPIHLCDESEDSPDATMPYVRHKSGTSFATPIAAGIGAFLLLYAKHHLPDVASLLRSADRMKVLLRRLSEKGQGTRPRDGYYFIDLSLNADGLFGKEMPFIDLTIRDVLSS